MFLHLVYPSIVSHNGQLGYKQLSRYGITAQSDDDWINIRGLCDGKAVNEIAQSNQKIIILFAADTF